jgi:hypothetical protein
VTTALSAGGSTSVAGVSLFTSVLPLMTSTSSTMSSWIDYLSSTTNGTQPSGINNSFINSNPVNNNNNNTVTSQLNFVMNNLTALPSKSFVTNYITFSPNQGDTLLYYFSVLIPASITYDDTPLIRYSCMIESANSTKIQQIEQAANTNSGNVNNSLVTEYYVADEELAT